MIAVERLRELLEYDPATGDLIWRVSRGNGVRGAVAGRVRASDGYRDLGIERKYYMAHRIVWALCKGEMPDGILDHIDGDRLNNRIENLRLSDNSLNQANAKPRRNSSGLKGVTWQKSNKKWQASIKVRGKSIYLGSYDTPEEAHQKYIEAARAHFGEHARAA